MANTTRGYPFPVGTDRVMDGDDAIKALAEAVDSKVGTIKVGAVASINADASSQYVLTHNLGRVPLFADMVPANSTFVAVPAISTATATQITVNFRRLDTGALTGAVAIGAANWFVIG